MPASEKPTEDAWQTLAAPGSGACGPAATEPQCAQPSAESFAAEAVAVMGVALTAPVFAVIERAPADHRFARETAVVSSAEFLLTTRREHKLLADGLPPGIYVRAFEDRLDLYSFAMVGPTETPYEGAVFTFDVHLPGNYPQTAPRVLYHSRCAGRANPNLYENGMVCLSLLGTWSGTPDESWQPGRSSLLQLCISIQALVLVRDPYFNEPGYEMQRGTAAGMEQARLYNETTVALTLESATSVLKRPPAVCCGK